MTEEGVPFGSQEWGLKVAEEKLNWDLTLLVWSSIWLTVFLHQVRIVVILLNANGIKKTNATPIETNPTLEKYTHRYKDLRISDIGKRNQRAVQKKSEETHPGKSLLKCLGIRAAWESLCRHRWPCSSFVLATETKTERLAKWVLEPTFSFHSPFLGPSGQTHSLSILPWTPQLQNCSLLFKIERSEWELWVG